MRVQIIHVTKRRSGEKGRRKSLIDVEELRIGRGTSNDLHLPRLAVEQDHSCIRPVRGGFQIRGLEAVDLEINGERVQERTLQTGDVVHISHFELRVLEARDDEDLCLEVEELVRLESSADALASRTQVGVPVGLFAPRKVAWALGLSILAAFVVLPLSLGVMKGSWDSGPLARAHVGLAEDCQACHAQGFTSVRDEQCMTCHVEVGAHSNPVPARLAETRCADCHLEHNGRSGLQHVEARDCADCHRDLHIHAKATKLRNVSDFSSDHPPFHLSLVQGADRSITRLAWNPQIKEESGLLFNHKTHVGRTSQHYEEPLDCSACHNLDAGGLKMAPLSFEKHCQSCHSLSFDSQFEGVQAPHAKLEIVKLELLGLYAERELLGRGGTAPMRTTRRLPNRAGGDASRKEALRRAESELQRALAFLTDPKKPGPCAQCHEMERGSELRVAPIRVVDTWLPKARFAHDAHAPFACADCHPRAAVYDAEAPDHDAAAEFPRVGPYALLTPEELQARHGLKPSDKSSDVLIPKLEACQACHGGAQASAPLVPSDCVMCHAFHLPEHGPMRSALE